MDLKGKVSVEIEPRNPIARLFWNNGKSIYLDEDGGWMPLSDKYTARVIVINGNLPDSRGDENSDKTWNELFILVQTIRSDAFLRAQVEQIYRNLKGDLILFPRVGKHSILLGNTQNLDRKFDKLKLFYKEGLSKVDWNKYKQIDLRYKNQVVCTKR